MRRVKSAPLVEKGLLICKNLGRAMAPSAPTALPLFAPMINRRANTNIHKKSSPRPKPAIAQCSEELGREEISFSNMRLF